MITEDTYVKDYYQILGVNINAKKKEIKKKYYELCLIYHPDKNNNDDLKFKEINEAYHILYDENKRRIYNLKYIIGEDIKFSDEELLLIYQIYDKIIESNEFRLLKLLYETLPKDIFIKKNKKQIIKSNKRIDIQNLNTNEIINFIIKKKNLKIIDIYTKRGIFYLYLRDFNESINIHNINCELTINFILQSTLL